MLQFIFRKIKIYKFYIIFKGFIYVSFFFTFIELKNEFILEICIILNLF